MNSIKTTSPTIPDQVSTKIYCDMDGVLCDFWSSASRLTDRLVSSLSVRELWTMTKQVPDFWVGLQWLPDAQILWEVVDRHQGHILTSLAYSDPNSGPGKLQWLENNIGLTDRSRIHLKMRWQKCEYALTDNMSNILIDDYIKNINEWREAGGIGILHENVSTTLEVLKKYGIQ